jgi:hypothetical protein
VQNFSLHLLDGLNPAEFEIHVASQPGGPLVEAVQKRGYIYHPLSQLRHPISVRDVLAFWQIYRLMRNERFDIVHTNSSKPGLLGRMAARLAGVPLIIHSSHGTPFSVDSISALIPICGAGMAGRPFLRFCGLCKPQRQIELRENGRDPIRQSRDYLQRLASRAGG